MRDTLKTECLMEAFERYYQAKAVEKREREAYTGYSWGYYGYDYIRAVELAAEEVQTQLANLVGAEVQKALKNILKED